MLSQSVINLIDTAMVGSLGEASLAAVGLASYLNFVAVSFVLGLSSAVQSLVARRRGQQRFAEMAVPVNSGLLLSLLFALPLSLLLIQLSAPLTALLNQDEAVLDIAEQYLDYRLLGLTAIAMNLSLRGWWNGTLRPGVYLRTLLVSHLLNVAISYCLIFGKLGLPAMGAAGAGLGTALALMLGAGINLVLVWRDGNQQRLLRFQGSVRRSVATVLRQSIPHSTQQVFFSAALMVLFWIIGKLGSDEQAIAHVLINLALFLILPAVGIGVAATSLVSEALGSGDTRRARQTGWDAVNTALMLLLLLSLPMWLIPEALLGLFLHSASLVEQAAPLLQITGLAICLDCAALVLTQALLGAGANRLVMFITTSGQWCFYLPLAWLAGPQFGWGLTGIWIVQLIHRCLSSVAFIYIWARGDWSNIRI